MMNTQMKMAVSALALSVMAACSPASSAKSPDQMNAKEKAAWGEFVREYLVENPEVIIEALTALEEKRAQEEIALKQDALPAILKQTAVPMLGPKDAPITIVEFYDYNCGFCKRSTDWVLTQLDHENQDVRVIFMDLPILTELSGSSGVAARASLAADKQGKFREFHQAMMKVSRIEDDTIGKVAKKVGLDYAQLQKDMASDEVEALLRDNIRLAREAAIEATPGFYVNKTYVSGANIPMLDALMEEARQKG